jgi:hypothetical protein
MPLLLPPSKSRAKAETRSKRDAILTIDWISIWAFSLGVCAILLAGLADLVAHDNIGAAFILIGAASIIATVVFTSAEADDEHV